MNMYVYMYHQCRFETVSTTVLGCLSSIFKFVFYNTCTCHWCYLVVLIQDLLRTSRGDIRNKVDITEVIQCCYGTDHFTWQEDIHNVLVQRSNQVKEQKFHSIQNLLVFSLLKGILMITQQIYPSWQGKWPVLKCVFKLSNINTWSFHYHCVVILVL